MTGRAEGSLTWGQAEIVDWLGLNGYSLPGVIAIRDITPQEGVPDPDLAASALTALATRHAALRTKIRIPRLAPGYRLGGAERPSQFVDDETGFVIERCDGDGEYTATEFARKVGDDFDNGCSTLDPRRDPSVGMIYRRPDKNYGTLLITSRVLTDGPGGRRLGEEFQSLVGGMSTDDLPTSVDPLTVTAHESSSARRELSRHNVAAMEELLRRMPEDLLIRPRGAAASATVTRSLSFADHVERLSKRYGIPKGGIVTALVSLLQWSEHGHDTVLVRALTQLPPPVRGASYVGPNALPALSAVSVKPEWTVREFFAQAWASIISSYRACNYDPAAFDHMQHLMAAPLGRELLDGMVYLNYHSMPEMFDVQDGAGSEAVLSHAVLDRHDRVFGTLFDIRDMPASMTLQVEGVHWTKTGDTLRQSRALLDLTAAIASTTNDDRSIGGRLCNRT